MFISRLAPWALCFVIFAATPSYSQFFFSYEEESNIIVFIDPGHGGRDLGARGSASILEKNINLQLATLIQKMISSHSGVEGILSRVDDIEISAVERINKANSLNADVYVSIHADGGPKPRKRATNIFVWSEPDSRLMQSDIDYEAWEMQNGKAIDGSVSLAHFIKSGLIASDPSKEINLISNNRLYLGGLSMPAVMVEAVDLANPEEELKLEEAQYIEAMAASISGSIIKYLQSVGKI